MKRKETKDGLAEIAAAMRTKSAIKKEELTLRCISELPDSEEKTSFLLSFLRINP